MSNSIEEVARRYRELRAARGQRGPSPSASDRADPPSSTSADPSAHSPGHFSGPPATTTATSPEAAFDARRSEANHDLLNLLGEAMAKNPSLRFSQILGAFGFVTSCNTGAGGACGTKGGEPQCQGCLDRQDCCGGRWWHDEFYLEPMDVAARVRKKLKKLSP